MISDSSIKNNENKDRKSSNDVEVEIKHRSKIKTFFLYVKSFGPLLLSHHPECNRFKEHTLKLGKNRLCIGCFIGYTASVATIVVILALNLNEIVRSQYFLWISIPLLSIFFLSLLNLTENKKVKVTQKISIGTGSALLINWIMLRPYPKNINLIFALITIWVLLIIFNIYHAYGFWKICDSCNTPFNWGYCEGFKRIRTNMEHYHLQNFMEGLDQFSRNRKIKNELKPESKNS